MEASTREQRIEAAFHRDMAEQRKVYDAGEIPPFYESITPEWLTAIFCRDRPDARVAGFRLDAPDDGTCNRRRLHIHYVDEDAAAGLPTSAFCKASHGLVNRLLLSASATFSEVTFYNRLRHELTIDAPVTYLAAYDPESWASIVMLRDMAGEVTFCDETTPMDRAAVERQLETLAAIHGPFFDSPRFRSDLADLLTFRFRLTNMDRRHGVGACCIEGLAAAGHLVPPRLHARPEMVWEATLRAVEWQAGQPETLTHSDVHLKNWYRRPDDGMGLADWQACGRGHWARDVGYAIATALPVEDRRAWERDLLAYYLDALARHGGPRIGFDDALRAYRAQMLGALAFWTLTYRPTSRMPDMQPIETTEAFVHRLGFAVDDLASLDAVE